MQQIALDFTGIYTNRGNAGLQKSVTHTIVHSVFPSQPQAFPKFFTDFACKLAKLLFTQGLDISTVLGIYLLAEYYFWQKFPFYFNLLNTFRKHAYWYHL